jgi:hypothetical protein
MRAVAVRRSAGLRSAGRLVAYPRPNPQDPTACLGFSVLPVEVPLLKQEVLTTNSTTRPTGQCSTFRRLLGSNRTWKPSAWTDLQICQMAP